MSCKGIGRRGILKWGGGWTLTMCDTYSICGLPFCVWKNAASYAKALQCFIGSVLCCINSVVSVGSRRSDLYFRGGNRMMDDG